MKISVSQLSKVALVFSAKDKESLSLIGTNCHSFYHISDCLLPVIQEILDRTDCQNTHQKTAASTTSRGFIVPKKGD
jgi:hypothetical protein